MSLSNFISRKSLKQRKSFFKTDSYDIRLCVALGVGIDIGFAITTGFGRNT